MNLPPKDSQGLDRFRKKYRSCSRRPILIRQTRITRIRGSKLATIPKYLLDISQGHSLRHRRSHPGGYTILVERTSRTLRRQLCHPDRLRREPIMHSREEAESNRGFDFIEMHRDGRASPGCANLPLCGTGIRRQARLESWKA